MDNQKLIRIATYASVSTAMILVAIKLTAWIRSDSVSILASLLDSTLDIAASLMIAFAVYIAQIPADEEHRFGHGKAEPLAAMAQSIFIAGSAVYLVIYSIERIFAPQAITHADTIIHYMIFSLILTLVLITFQRYVIAKTQSTAIRADSLHYLSDVFANILVIVSLWLSHVNWVDPVLALLIALWILHSAASIARDASHQLLDHELPETERQTMVNIILKHPDVRGVNDLRTYQSGPNKFMQCDLELDDFLTLRASHSITEEVTQQLKSQFSDLDVMIHQEPVSLQGDPEHHTWGAESNNKLQKHLAKTTENSSLNRASK